MEYRIVIEEHRGHRMVHTYIKGELSAEDRSLVGAQAIQAVRSNGLTMSIWDLREATITYSLASIHLAAAHPETEGLFTEMRVAIVYRQNKMEFTHAKLVSQNRGVPNVNYFERLEDAIEWLIGAE